MSNESPNPDPYATSDQPSPPGVSTATYHPDEGVGSMIGPYKLLQLMGKGGMGAVWMAEQTEPVQRRVAVKIIKAGLEGYQVLARFEAERQALAMMDHPNIAKVLDAGATAAGRPYFVMELVKGIAFTKYCDQEHLTPKERLELFIPVCNAVQHAHQKGIIHRDLKPSNVLIALYDGKPVPKVIDFGIAKATHQKLTERTMFTEVGQIVGTLEYMAPEQAEMNNLDIDTRADIYSLGVMLYELLTGGTPFSAKQLRGEAFLEMLRLIREVEPAKPSTRLSKSEELPAIAARRKLEPKKLAGLVRGDLDWIVMKCLEKERTRRYETANQLGQELGRFLADEPVQAGPPSAGYRIRKFVRRNKGQVMAAALVLLALVGGVIGTSIGFLYAESALRKAERAVEAERQANAIANARLAHVEAANDLLVLSMELPVRFGEDDEARKKGLLNRLDQAVGRLDDLGKGDPITAARLHSIAGAMYRDNFPERKDKATSLLSQALATQQDRLGMDHPNTLYTVDHLASAFLDNGDPVKAIPLLTVFIRNLEANRGPDHDVTMDKIHLLAEAYFLAGDAANGLGNLELVMERTKAKLGVENEGTEYLMRELAENYVRHGKAAGAVPLFEQVLKGKRAKLDAAFDANTKTGLACAFLEIGDLDKAAPLFAGAELGGFGGLDEEIRLSRIGEALLKHKHFQRAEAILQRCFKVQIRSAVNSGSLDPGFWTDHTVSMLGGSLLGQKKYAEAEPLLKEGYEGMKQREKTMPPQALPRLTEALERLVQLYDATGNAAEAERYRKEMAARKAAQKEPKK